MDALSIALWLLAGLAGLLGLVTAGVVMSGINRLDDSARPQDPEPATHKEESP